MESILTISSSLGLAALVAYVLGALAIFFVESKDAFARYFPITIVILGICVASFPVSYHGPNQPYALVPMGLILGILCLVAWSGVVLIRRHQSLLRKLTGTAALILFATVSPLVIAGIYQSTLL